MVCTKCGYNAVSQADLDKHNRRNHEDGDISSTIASAVETGLEIASIESSFDSGSSYDSGSSFDSPSSGFDGFGGGDSGGGGAGGDW